MPPLEVRTGAVIDNGRRLLHVPGIACDDGPECLRWSTGVAHTQDAPDGPAPDTLFCVSPYTKFAAIGFRNEAPPDTMDQAIDPALAQEPEHTRLRDESREEGHGRA